MIRRPAYAVVWIASIIAACSSGEIAEDSFSGEPDETAGTRNMGARVTGSRSGSGGANATGEDTESRGGSASDDTDVAPDGAGGNPSDDGSGGSDDPTKSANSGGSGQRADGGVTRNRGGSGNTAGAGSTAGSRTGGGGAAEGPECTDIQTADHQGEPCSIWVDWGHCNADWLQGFCNKTCGRCNGSSTSTGTGTGTGTGSTGRGGAGSGTSSTVTVTPLGNDAQTGWASRYWDCCKPHCAWPGRAPSGTMKMCTQANAPLSDSSAASSCDNGPAYTCWDMAPWAVSDKVAYGYAATPAGGNDCGKCYQLDFTGNGQHNANDPGSKAIAGKTIIVQATNIGGDVGTGQFDIMVPGGGVGAFNGCSRQWGTSSLGAQYGGFVNECDTGGGHDAVKSCVSQKCKSVFSKAGMEDLLAGCLFYVEWFQAANNPKLRYKQVPCPAALTSKSGMSG